MTRRRTVAIPLLALLLAVLVGCAPEQAAAAPPPIISGAGTVREVPQPPAREPETSQAEEAEEAEAPESSSSSSPSSQSTAPVSSSAPASSAAPAPSSSVPSSSSQAAPRSSTPEEPDSLYDDEEEYEEDEPSSGGSSSGGSSSGTEERGDMDTTTGGTLTVTAGGSRVSGNAADIVARIVTNEMGSSFPAEAVKAQAVAAYTYVKYYNSIGQNPSVGLGSPSDKTKSLVNGVIGQTVRYNGALCLATYCAYNSGYTASAKSVWGGSGYSYLISKYSSYDDDYNGPAGTTTKISAGTVQSKLENALNISLDDVVPEDWFDILSWHDDTDYVNQVRIGGQKTITARTLRESILGPANLRSTDFEVEYDSGSDKFVFVTRGYGHGVGMSQQGAKLMAQDGWDYIDILEFYFDGATVS